MANNISHSFTVSSVDLVQDIDVYVNILKRRETFIFQQSLPTSSVNVSFSSSTSVTSNTSLSIADRSTSIIANRILETGYTTISDTDTFTIDTDEFVVTNVFVDLLNTTTETPLFYQHIISLEKLPRDEDGNVQTGYTLQDVQILDQYLQTAYVQEQKVNYTKGIFYTNLQSEYNSSSDYTIYFVKYRVRLSNGEVFEYTDLLNVEPIFKLATFEDLDESLSIINDGRTVYLIEEELDHFVIRLPAIGSYAYKFLSAGRIRLLLPASQEIDSPWFVKVSNSNIYTTINETLYKYSIGEFLSQTFFPAPPYKTINEEEAKILTSTLIKADQENIIIDNNEGLYVSVQVDDVNGNGKAAYTADPLLEGTLANNGLYYQKWDYVNQQGIKSVDGLTGIIEVDGIELKSTDTVVIAYTYEERNYEYTPINFNPIINTSVLNGRVSIFVDPDTPATSKDQTLYYLNIDSSGRVFESNYPYFDNTLQMWNNGAGNKTLYYEDIPNFITTGIADVGEYNYVNPSGIDLFVPNYSTEGDNYVNFLILGDVSVNPGISINDITTIDSRNRGGGIIETQLTDTIDIYPEASLVWDHGHWDGFPYPGNASYLVEVPITILEGAGGELTQYKVRENVERHTAAGVYPVVKGYGVDINLDSLEPTASGITIRWQSNGY